MQLLKPGLLSGELLTLFDESDKKVIIVSPYVKIDKWYKLQKRFTSLRDRNVEIEFYIRNAKNNFESFEQVRNLGIEPIGVSNLHAKLYMNEKSAIVTSMNLLFSSEINSLDIGYKTQTAVEYKELLDYYDRYLKISSHTKKLGPSLDWRDQLYDALTREIGEVSIKCNNDNLYVQTRKNNYNCFIANEYEKNILRISGILSNSEYLRIKQQLQQIITRTGLKLELNEGKSRYYDSIWCTLAKELKSITIDEILFPEQEIAVASILKFINEVERIKSEKEF